MNNTFCTKIENEKINPLIRTSITLNEQKYLKNINKNTKFNLNKITLKKIFHINSKAFILYKQNFKNYLEKHRNLDLIKQLKKPVVSEEKYFNIRISNYIY